MQKPERVGLYSRSIEKLGVTPWLFRFIRKSLETLPIAIRVATTKQGHSDLAEKIIEINVIAELIMTYLIREGYDAQLIESGKKISTIMEKRLELQALGQIDENELSFQESQTTEQSTLRPTENLLPALLGFGNVQGSQN